MDCLVIFFILCVFFKLFVLSIAQDSSMDDSYCNYDYNGTYTANSTYKTYIQTIPNVLSGSDATFYNFSLGNRPDDTINVIALCRGDVEINRCQSCLRRAHYELAAKCTNQKESIIWKDECMLRYSDRAIFKVVNTLPNASGVNPVLAADANDFKKNVRSLLDKLKEEAGTGTSVLKFATGNFSVAGKSTVYGLVQCTPDLTTKQCEDCLNASFAELPSCCDGSIGGRVVMPSCNFRYETGTPFYNVTGVDTTQHSTTGKGNDDRKKKVIIVIVAIPVSLVVCIGGYICYICYFKNKKHNMYSKGFSDVSVEMSREEAEHYDFDTVKRATKDFSDDNKLGCGGFGAVYKGTLPGGREIAVKRLSKLLPQGEKAFKTEVVVLGNLQHRNLVKLRGYSITARERLLIYEFIANGSLDNFIFDREKRSNLNWDTRFKIITGVARGLLYLHEDSRHRIVHRDLKPGNILLDSNMCPKIADFGLAKFFKDEVTRAHTKNIAGTRGYMAPEYRNGGTLSVKSDVFSFGVVVLEIITGQKNNFVNGENEEYLPIYVWKKWRDGRDLDVIDPLLEDPILEDSILEMRRCIYIALHCVQTNVVNRPTTMSYVVDMLSNKPFEPQDLQMPSERQEIPSQPQQEPLTLSNNEVTITDLTGR